jgi:hypothetical protein
MKEFIERFKNKEGQAALVQVRCGVLRVCLRVRGCEGTAVALMTVLTADD